MSNWRTEILPSHKADFNCNLLLLLGYLVILLQNSNLNLFYKET